MIAAANPPTVPAFVAFDELAEHYDKVFTRSLIGSAQRAAVWRVMRRVFKTGDRILEVNCGTGEDAFFLARHGMTVVACDGSSQMVEIAVRRGAERQQASVSFRVLRTEDIGVFRGQAPFDGLLSNFSGLNCLCDVPAFFAKTAELLRPGAGVVLCMSSRVCAWEVAWFGLRGRWGEALRRIPGQTVAVVHGRHIAVWYPRISTVVHAASPWFRAEMIAGIGITVPPSYAENWAQRHSKLMGRLAGLDRRICRWPVIRSAGDHFLLVFRRSEV